MFGDVRDVLDLAGQQCDQLRLEEVALLSPSYMNGTRGYQLGRLKEIWAGRSMSLCYRFILEDGTDLHFTSEPAANPQELAMERVLVIEPWAATPMA